MMTVEVVRTRCCIAGGGPAGMMLGLLLARAGIDVVVLEKHADFLRDFRGDTIHPSTLEVMHELGLLGAFLQRPHQEVSRIGGRIGGRDFVIADFSYLRCRCPFVAFMPQWDFLDFIADHARTLPAFALRMETEAVDLVSEAGRVVGVKARSPQGEVEFRADLVVAADGRHSTLRERAAMDVDNLGAPMDVLWFRLSRAGDDPDLSLGHVAQGRILVMINRGDYWQCGFVIAKGEADAIRRRGLAAFGADVARLAPFARGRVGELDDWDKVKLLTVAVDRLRQWYKPGLLCIGDAAHAMSPVGGVGINLAIQDAVATANILAPRFLGGRPEIADLQQVQRRREFPTRVTQGIQLFLQKRVISRVLRGQDEVSAPWPLRLLDRFPILRWIPARVIGIGVRPEHVATPAKA